MQIERQKLEINKIYYLVTDFIRIYFSSDIWGRPTTFLPESIVVLDCQIA